MVALDIAHKLLVEDQVVVCKMNPVNAWAGPFIRCATPPAGLSRQAVLLTVEHVNAGSCPSFSGSRIQALQFAALSDHDSCNAFSLLHPGRLHTLVDMVRMAKWDSCLAA